MLKVTFCRSSKSFVYSSMYLTLIGVQNHAEITDDFRSCCYFILGIQIEQRRGLYHISFYCVCVCYVPELQKFWNGASPQYNNPFLFQLAELFKDYKQLHNAFNLQCTASQLHFILFKTLLQSRSIPKVYARRYLNLISFTLQRQA